MNFAYLISDTKIKDERLGFLLKLKRFLAQSPTRGELINLSRRPITTIETSQTTHRYQLTKSPRTPQSLQDRGRGRRQSSIHRIQKRPPSAEKTSTKRAEITHTARRDEPPSAYRSNISPVFFQYRTFIVCIVVAFTPYIEAVQKPYFFSKKRGKS